MSSLPYVNYELVNFVQKKNPKTRATLDMDATLTETLKKDALFCYQGPKSYHPYNVLWYEHNVVFHSEFRDGNVPAGFGQLRILKECLSSLPSGVEEVYIRSDSAGYQHELLKYCAEGKDERFGRIGFAISIDIYDGFKRVVLTDRDIKWRPIYKEISPGLKIKSGQEWSEICYVPTELCKSKKSPDYLFIAIREELKQKVLPGMEDQLDLPFPTIEMGQKRYKLTGIVTNLDREGDGRIGG